MVSANDKGLGHMGDAAWFSVESSLPFSDLVTYDFGHHHKQITSTRFIRENHPSPAKYIIPFSLSKLPSELISCLHAALITVDISGLSRPIMVVKEKDLSPFDIKMKTENWMYIFFF